METGKKEEVEIMKENEGKRTKVRNWKGKGEIKTELEVRGEKKKESLFGVCLEANVNII